MNLIIDLSGFVRTLFRQVNFRSLETICIIGSGCHVRKIFSLKGPVEGK
jgi:hypothetical protein